MSILNKLPIFLQKANAEMKIEYVGLAVKVENIKSGNMH